MTFLFTDLEGSTRPWEEHPEPMRAALARHDEIPPRGREARRARRQDHRRPDRQLDHAVADMWPLRDEAMRLADADVTTIAEAARSGVAD